MAQIERSKRGGRTAYLEMGVWFNEDTGHIHMALPKTDWFHTTVNKQAGSKRCHENLYHKLARALQEAGAPAPSDDD
jgi:hypothetical protein